MPAQGRDAFFVAPSNALAVRRLENWLDWPDQRLVLCGPKGAGKTHLAQVWAAETGALVCGVDILTNPDFDYLSSQRHIVLENADAVGGDEAREAALFHMYNIAQSAGIHVLFTAVQPPAYWPLDLPDLKSRMDSVCVVSLKSPDDALLSALLVKLFADRQIAVSPDLVPYLLGRMERSAEAAQHLVQRLDNAALATKSPLSKRLAARVLDLSHNKGA